MRRGNAGWRNRFSTANEPNLADIRWMQVSAKQLRIFLALPKYSLYVAMWAFLTRSVGSLNSMGGGDEAILRRLSPAHAFRVEGQSLISRRFRVRGQTRLSMISFEV